MSTAVEPIDQNIDTVPQKKQEEGEEEEENEIQEKQPFMWYMKPYNIYELLQKKWVSFSLVTAIPYCYSFVMAVYGTDMYCHYSRFFRCDLVPQTADQIRKNYVPFSPAQYNEYTAVFDTYIMLCNYHHIVQWLCQWCLLTAIIVGYKWMMRIYYVLAIIEAPYGLVVTFIGFLIGVTNSCSNNQVQRATYLKLQGISFVLMIPFSLHPVYIFKLLDKYLHPQDKDKKGNLLYESYLHKLWNEQEEDEDD